MHKLMSDRDLISEAEDALYRAPVRRLIAIAIIYLMVGLSALSYW